MSTLVSRGIDRLVGHQATNLPTVYLLLGGGRDPDLMHPELRLEICRLLRTLGYCETVVIEQDSDEAQRMWVRDPWPADFERLRRSRKVETYTRL